MQLDFSFLSSEAKSVASEVATEKQLYLVPEALPAIDVMVDERKEAIQHSWRDIDTWRKHVRDISASPANIYITRRVRRIAESSELLVTARRVYAVYPYD